MKSAKHITILGAGSWGTALALALARNGHYVLLWGKWPAELEIIQAEKCNNKYLPGISFPPTINVEPHLETSIRYASCIILAVPSHAVREMVLKIKPFIHQDTAIIAAKGIDPQSGLLMPEVLSEVLGRDEQIAVLAGPTFAKEIAKNMPSAMTIASKNTELALQITKLFQQRTLKPYINHDVIGTALGGTVKNVIAIAVGISDGHGYGANAKSALITRGLAEIMRLGRQLGAQSETLFGLSGVGDLVLTCTDDQSRNRRFGLLLGQGITAEKAIEKIGQIVEGASNAEQVFKLAQKYHIEMPITELVFRVLHENLSTYHAVERLLSRDVREEGV
jgi:glycerol-3-phosphate dehydrogenase (NAD(P)+)